MRVYTKLCKLIVPSIQPFENLPESSGRRRHQQNPHYGDTFETEISNTSLGDNIQLNYLLYSSKSLIEVDGALHFDKTQMEYDQARTEYLENLGYKVIRFTNDDVRYNIHSVVAKILEEVEVRIQELQKNNNHPPS